MNNKLSKDIIALMEKQGFIIVSSLNAQGSIHCSAKGIVGIEEEKVYLIDLYKARTYKNLSKNPTVSITFISEHNFMGYTLQGKARIVEKAKIADHIIEAWEDKVISRISQRVIKNLQNGKQSIAHPEASFPHPKYLIEIDIEKIIDLAPSVNKL